MSVIQTPHRASAIEGPLRRFRGRLALAAASLNEPIASMSAFDLCAVVTLLLLFLYAGTHWYLMVPTRAICLCAIIIPRLRHSPPLWYALLILLVAVNYYDRYLIDNHKYLLTYWVMAVLLASLSEDPIRRDDVLSFNGRVLMGLCFAFAVIAKLASPDYLDGGFFRRTLLLDGRFTSFTWLAGGVNPNALLEMKRAAHDLAAGYVLNIDVGQVHLFSSPRFSALVWFMTCWTLLIESALALVFLWPGKSAPCDWGRRYLLWIFLVTTYSVALVAGFAWTLAVMGLAQLPRSQARFRIIYILVVAVVLQFYEIHYVSLARSIAGYFTNR